MSTSDSQPVVAYVLRKFPKLSETFVLQEILGLEAAGVKVHIYSLMPPTDPRFHDDLSKLKAQVWYVPDFVESRNRRSLRLTNRDAAKRFGRPYWKAFRRALATGRPTMLWRFLQAGWIAERAARIGVERFHAHFATRATTVAGLVSQICDRPYSFTAHAVDIYRADVDKRILNHKIAAASFVATVSEANMRHLSGVANGSSQKLVLLHNGIDMTRFRPDTKREPTLTFFSVARLVEKKGCRYLIEACRILAERGVSFRCEIAGRGNLRKPLLEQIRNAGLQDHVRLLGGRKQNDVLKRYRKTYAYVLPSIVASDGNREGLPVSIVEALACGVPVISTPSAGIPEVVRHGHNGLLVPEKDTVALADAMERLVKDRALYDKLHGAARPSVEQTFDTSRTSDRLRRLFAEAG